MCWFHGGRTATGPASPFWKHGAYSKYLPTRYKHAFELSLSDPEITSVKYQLALLDSREAELLKRLDTSESGVLWAKIKEAAAQLKQVMTSGKPDLQQVIANDLVNRIDTWADNDAQWAELYQIFEMRRRLADTERKREEGLNAHLTLDEMTQIAAFLAGMLRRYITDGKTLRSASVELSEFFGLFQSQQPLIEAELVSSEVGESGERAVSDSPAVVVPPMPKDADSLNGAVMSLSEEPKRKGRATDATPKPKSRRQPRRN